MNPFPLTSTEPDEPLTVLPVLTWWVRGVLLALAVALVAVFAVALRLNPYYQGDPIIPDGTPRTMETHRQLGLPPCTFKDKTNLPCPSCGMTTSFALLIRGDVWNSLQANCVGTLLALACLLFIPWSLASVLLGRPLFVITVERPLVIGVIALVLLMLVRWVFVLGMYWWTST
jgi:hypothetical protein